MLTQTQAIVVKDKHRFRVLRCGRRWGKTTLSCKEIKGLAISRESKIAYIANNYQQARDIMWEMLKKELAPATIDTNESRLEIRVKTQDRKESLVVLRGWESIENLRGQAFDFIILDEVAMMRNFWALWQEVLRPTLTDRKGQALFASTPRGFNHFYDLCNQELTDEDYKSFNFTSYDNPNLPIDELETAKRTLPRERFEQEYMASFQKTQGLVYKEFSRQQHVYKELPTLLKFQKVAGIDFGYTNPAAVLDIRTNGDRFFIENEWYKRERTDIQIAEYVAQSHFDAVYPDPESPAAIEELRRARVNVREVVKGKDSIENGIKKVKELLLSGRLSVNARCINLISEFEMYSYDDEGSDRNLKEKPIKANDHALDALRYVVSMMQPIPKPYIDPIWNQINNKEINPAI